MIPPQPEVTGVIPPPEKLQNKVLLKGKMIQFRDEDDEPEDEAPTEPEPTKKGKKESKGKKEEKKGLKKEEKTKEQIKEEPNAKPEEEDEYLSSNQISVTAQIHQRKEARRSRKDCA